MVPAGAVKKEESTLHVGGSARIFFEKIWMKVLKLSDRFAENPERIFMRDGGVGGRSPLP